VASNARPRSCQRSTHPKHRIFPLRLSVLFSFLLRALNGNRAPFVGGIERLDALLSCGSSLSVCPVYSFPAITTTSNAHSAIILDKPIVPYASVQGLLSICASAILSHLLRSPYHLNTNFILSILLISIYLYINRYNHIHLYNVFRAFAYPRSSRASCACSSTLISKSYAQTLVVRSFSLLYPQV
jgi:hypothetical protein